MKDSPSVNLIILNWNGRDFLEDLLDSIDEKTSYSNYDVTVVDNGSEDASKDLVRAYPDVELVENERNLGYSIGNNVGIYESTGYDYYLLLNNDMKAKANWLSELVESAEEKEAGITGAKLFFPDGTIQHAGGEINFEGNNHIGADEEDRFDEDREVEYVTGAAMLISKQVIEDIGYLDEIFTPASNEDTDYCMRARKAGHSIYFSSNSEMIHYEGKSREKEVSEFNYFLERKNAIKFSLMNVSGVDFLRFLKEESKMAAGAVIGYKQNSLPALMKAYKEVLMDLPELLKKRFNRTEFIPSYYCEDIRDYSRRYED